MHHTVPVDSLVSLNHLIVAGNVEKLFFSHPFLLKGWEAERKPRAFLLQGSSGNRNASLEFQFYVFEAELLQEHE